MRKHVKKLLITTYQLIGLLDDVYTVPTQSNVLGGSQALRAHHPDPGGRGGGGATAKNIGRNQVVVVYCQVGEVLLPFGQTLPKHRGCGWKDTHTQLKAVVLSQLFRC